MLFSRLYAKKMARDHEIALSDTFSIYPVSTIESECSTMPA
jgi:hypothetical protein